MNMKGVIHHVYSHPETIHVWALIDANNSENRRANEKHQLKLDGASLEAPLTLSAHVWSKTLCVTLWFLVCCRSWPGWPCDSCVLQIMTWMTLWFLVFLQIITWMTLWFLVCCRSWAGWPWDAGGSLQTWGPGELVPQYEVHQKRTADHVQRIQAGKNCRLWTWNWSFDVPEKWMDNTLSHRLVMLYKTRRFYWNLYF